MSTFYFPSCKFTAKYPNISKSINDYFEKKSYVNITKCCRPCLETITAEDTLVYVCNTCVTFFKESSKSKKIISLWEFIIEDDSFIYPDYKHLRLTVQDCWRNHDDKLQQDAVRELLHRMNINVVELKENRDKTTFCGYSLYDSLPSGYQELAPKRLGQEAVGLFVPHNQEQKEKLMKEHCQQIETENVVCYCVSCTNGINLGQKRGVHLSELLFSDKYNC